MSRVKRQLSDLIKTISILVLSLIVCLFMQNIFEIEHLIPAIFTVSVFLITLITRGYIYDVGSTKKLQVNMANIRKKMGAKPGENKYIQNELYIGYRMKTE